MLESQEENDSDVNCDHHWVKQNTVEGGESLLQLNLSEDETHLLGTTALGFCIWNVSVFFDDNCRTEGKRTDLKLPTGVRNISVKLLHSNSVILSKGGEFAVAGVRYVVQVVIQSKPFDFV